jgi:hypothetical protein
MSKHHFESVPPGLECAAYLIDIDDNDYCEFQTNDGLWHSSPYCSDVVKHLLQTGFHSYLKTIDQADCKATLRRLIQNGPPLYLNDKTFNISEDQYIMKVWFKSENREIDAIYSDAPTEDDRMRLWDQHKAIFEQLPDDIEN